MRNESLKKYLCLIEKNSTVSASSDLIGSSPTNSKCCSIQTCARKHVTSLFSNSAHYKPVGRERKSQNLSCEITKNVAALAENSVHVEACRLEKSCVRKESFRALKLCECDGDNKNNKQPVSPCVIFDGSCPTHFFNHDGVFIEMHNCLLLHFTNEGDLPHSITLRAPHLKPGERRNVRKEKKKRKQIRPNCI